MSQGCGEQDGRDCYGKYLKGLVGRPTSARDSACCCTGTRCTRLARGLEVGTTHRTWYSRSLLWPPQGSGCNTKTAISIIPYVTLHRTNAVHFRSWWVCTLECEMVGPGEAGGGGGGGIPIHLEKVKPAEARHGAQPLLHVPQFVTPACRVAQTGDYDPPLPLLHVPRA